MTDETDDQEVEEAEIEFEPYSDAEYIDSDDATYILPHGAGWLADTVGGLALRITYGKPSRIEALMPTVGDGTSFRWMDIQKIRKHTSADGQNNVVSLVQ